MDNNTKIRDLITELSKNTELYDKGVPVISDREYDDIYFKLKELEEQTGIIFEDSPTQSIRYEVVNSLEKVEHDHLMLSLDKTKATSDLDSFLGRHPYLAMLKMDGLTCSLRYEDGMLVKAETRGDGKIGENILHNAKVIPSIPKTINYKSTLVVDGEIICTTKDFETFAEEYKNPRNFAAGSIRLLDANESAKRKLTFVAWDVIKGFEDTKQLDLRFENLMTLGFTVVPAVYFPNKAKADYEKMFETLRSEAKVFGYPYDGFVFKFNEYEIRKTMGSTAHHMKDAIAFKEYDEEYESTLIDIEWSMGRTGKITPIAVFEPVDIDGSTVEKASLHNLTVMNTISHGLQCRGDKVNVAKMNMIIPQIMSWNHSEFCLENVLPVPTVCPVCGQPTEVIQENDSQVLMCVNPTCEGKFINQLEHFVSKKGLDIKGFSKATLEKLVDWGWIENKIDIFELGKHRSEWVKKPGFGPKSVDNILIAIETAKHVSLDKYIAALGIPLIGTSVSKELVKIFPEWIDFMTAIKTGYKFFNLNGFGPEKHEAIVNYNYSEAEYIADNYIKFTIEENNNTNSLKGLTFVITGKLNNYKRDELKAKIEENGGKVTGSVSKNTSYLVCNETGSTSSKAKSAQALGISILTEDELIKKFDF